MGVQAKIELTGPFFEKDAKKVFRANAREMLQGIADEGEARVLSSITFKRGPAPFHIEDDVIGRVKALTGKPWALTAVVSVPNARHGYVFSPYGRFLDRRTRFFSRGIGSIRKERREAERLLRGLE